MVDLVLHIVFRISGSRVVSERINKRRMDRRYRAQRDAHLASGGVVATYASDAGEQVFFL